MNNFNIKYQLLSIIIIVMGCREQKQDNFAFNKETLRIKFFDNYKFEYFYYKLDDSSFKNSRRSYCNGEYSEISKNEYKLIPSVFNYDSIDTRIQLTDLKDNQNIHLIFDTEIRGDKQNEYEILVYYNLNKFQIKGTKVDTTISAESGSKIRFEILLPYFYVKGQPAPMYSKLSTKSIDIGEAKTVKIYTPITLDYFYYISPGKIILEDKGKYYLVNNKKIKKG
jgi:hypothetical protein